MTNSRRQAALRKKQKKQHQQEEMLKLHQQTVEPQPTVGESTITEEHFTAHIGPLPAPETLAEYESIQVGLVDRIVKMAENEALHRHSMDKDILAAQIEDARADRVERRIGQFLGFAIGFIAIIAGAIVASKGQPLSGGIIGSAGVIGLVAVFVYGRRSEATERNETQTISTVSP